MVFICRLGLGSVYRIYLRLGEIFCWWSVSEIIIGDFVIFKFFMVIEGG